MTETPHDPTPRKRTPDEPSPEQPHDESADVDERPAPSDRDAPAVDPEAPGAALVDPTVEQAEPNEPG